MLLLVSMLVLRVLELTPELWQPLPYERSHPELPENDMFPLLFYGVYRCRPFSESSGTIYEVNDDGRRPLRRVCQQPGVFVVPRMLQCYITEDFEEVLKALYRRRRLRDVICQHGKIRGLQKERISMTRSDTMGNLTLIKADFPLPMRG